MSQNRMRGFDMSPGDESNDARQRSPVAAFRRLQGAPFSPLSVSVADIYQAAISQAVHDHELNKLFNPDYYDYEI